MHSALDNADLKNSILLFSYRFFAETCDGITVFHLILYCCPSYFRDSRTFDNVVHDEDCNQNYAQVEVNKRNGSAKNCSSTNVKFQGDQTSYYGNSYSIQALFVRQ
jgi:hypothetical protein